MKNKNIMKLFLIFQATRNILVERFYTTPYNMTGKYRENTSTWGNEVQDNINKHDNVQQILDNLEENEVEFIEGWIFRILNSKEFPKIISSIKNNDLENYQIQIAEKQREKWLKQHADDPKYNGSFTTTKINELQKQISVFQEHTKSYQNKIQDTIETFQEKLKHAQSVLQQCSDIKKNCKTKEHRRVEKRLHNFCQNPYDTTAKRHLKGVIDDSRWFQSSKVKQQLKDLTTFIQQHRDTDLFESAYNSLINPHNNFQDNINSTDPHEGLTTEVKERIENYNEDIERLGKEIKKLEEQIQSREKNLEDYRAEIRQQFDDKITSQNRSLNYFQNTLHKIANLNTEPLSTKGIHEPVQFNLRFDRAYWNERNVVRDELIKAFQFMGINLIDIKDEKNITDTSAWIMNGR